MLVLAPVFRSHQRCSGLTPDSARWHCWGPLCSAGDQLGPLTLFPQPSFLILPCDACSSTAACSPKCSLHLLSLFQAVVQWVTPTHDFALPASSSWVSLPAYNFATRLSIQNLMRRWK